jgi:uncharacterized membrane protein YhaH (DUF805 family)
LPAGIVILAENEIWKQSDGAAGGALPPASHLCCGDRAGCALVSIRSHWRRVVERYRCTEGLGFMLRKTSRRTHNKSLSHTVMKKWLQREKKRLLHELSSKAHRRLNVVCLVSFVIIFLYEEAGKRALSVQVAHSVPMVWKCLTFLAMFATLWYADWRIQRRVFDLSLPALEPGWFVWLALVAFSFAVVSADARILFYLGGLSCLIYFWVSDKYYTWKGKRLRDPESPAQEGQEGKRGQARKAEYGFGEKEDMDGRP